MIRLNGLKPKIKDDKGDIEIIFTGLKNGEKFMKNFHTLNQKTLALIKIY